MAVLANMIETHPRFSSEESREFATELEVLSLCEQSCLLCADACLEEKSPGDLRVCIQRNLDCAAVCRATAGMLLRRTQGSNVVLHSQLHACVAACQACRDECALHARLHRHCTVCADICRECQEVCNAALARLAPGEDTETA